MTGFNMPPGCSPSDIPGNRPEDLAQEALADHIQDGLAAVPAFAMLSDESQMTIETVVATLCGESYAQGYSQGQADESLAVEQKPKGVEMVGFLPEDYHRLCELQRMVHNRERSFTFDEQRDFAESLRVALANGQETREEA